MLSRVMIKHVTVIHGKLKWETAKITLEDIKGRRK
jgi:hypothetical protein